MRNRTPMAFGEGLDRETGSMAVQPNTFSDLRNVFLHEGKVVLRPGFTERATFDEVDSIVAGAALKSERVGIVVGHSSTTERVFVYRVSADGTEVELLGEWEHDRGGWGSGRPTIIMAEVYGKVFMAHDEPVVTRRAPTMYYDPTGGGADVLNPLLEEGGESVGDAIRFRGVIRHLSYLVGWGWGSTTENRPELVRISLPGEPTVFEPNAYVIAGDRQDPVVACFPAGSILLAAKRTETYAIPGYDRRTFGIQLVDPRYGLTGSRLWVNVGGVAIAWSEEGPRAWTGLSASEPLEIPLDLRGFEPDDLPAKGEEADAFAFYVPGERVLWFVFGRRVYALTVRVPGRWRWSYQELGFDAYCGFTLFSGAETTVAPPGFPEFVSAVAAGTYADISVRHVNHDGDETLEVWMREAPAEPPASGSAGELEGGAFVGFTDFSEYEEGEYGLTELEGLTLAENATTPGTVSIENEEGVGNFLRYVNDAEDSDPKELAVGFDWAADLLTEGEMLARVRVSDVLSSNPEFTAALGVKLDTLALSSGVGALMAEAGDDENLIGAALIGGSIEGTPVGVDPGSPPAWVWMRVRVDDAGGGDTRVRVQFSLGETPDAPGTWDIDETAADASTAGLMAFIASATTGEADAGVAVLSFSTDPDTYPVPVDLEEYQDLVATYGAGEEEEEEEPAWFLARSLAAGVSATQTVRVSALTAGTDYEVALRHRRGTRYNAGAESSVNPGGWPSISRGELSTTVDPPVIAGTEWERTGQGVNALASIDISSWTTGGATPPDITSGVKDPAGGTNAYLIGDSDPATFEWKRANVTFGESGSRPWGVFVRKASAPNSQAIVKLQQSSSPSASRGQYSIGSWTGNRPNVSTSVGTLSGVRGPYYDEDGEEWYWIRGFSSAALDHAATNRIEIAPAGLSDAAQTGNLYVFMPFAIASGAGDAAPVGETVTLTITPAEGLEDLDIQVFRDGTLIGGVLGPHVGDVEFIDLFPTGETTHEYQVRTVGENGPGALSEPTEVWVGPSPAPVRTYLTPYAGGYEVGFTPADESYATEAWDEYDDNGSYQAQALRATSAPGASSVYSGLLSNVPPGGLDVQVRIRHKLTTLGVDDHSEFYVPHADVHLNESE